MGKLVANPGADMGAGGTGEPSQAIPGWTMFEGAAALIRYDAGNGYPGPIDPGPADRGPNFFGGGNSARTRIGQEITLPHPGEIDLGRARFDCGGWRAAGPHRTMGPVTAGERSNVTGLVKRKSSGTVPPGSRRARVLLAFTRAGGTSTDGYADSLWLRVIGTEFVARTSNISKATATATTFTRSPPPVGPRTFAWCPTAPIQTRQSAPSPLAH